MLQSVDLMASSLIVVHPLLFPFKTRPLAPEM